MAVTVTTTAQRHPGGRPPKEGVRRDQRVTLHFSADEYDRLNEEARDSGNALAAVVRAHVLRSLRMEGEKMTP